MGSIPPGSNNNDRKMFLWVWGRVQSLTGTSPGLCIAYAATKQEAIDRVVMAARNSLVQPALKRLVRAELEATAPVIYADAWGIALWGEDFEDKRGLHSARSAI